MSPRELVTVTTFYGIKPWHFRYHIVLWTIFSTAWLKGCSCFFAMWTLHRAIHMRSITGLLASLCQKATNAGTCPLLSPLRVVLIANS